MDSTVGPHTAHHNQKNILLYFIFLVSFCIISVQVQCYLQNISVIQHLLFSIELVFAILTFLTQLKVIGYTFKPPVLSSLLL